MEADGECFEKGIILKARLKEESEDLSGLKLMMKLTRSLFSVDLPFIHVIHAGISLIVFHRGELSPFVSDMKECRSIN